MYVCIYVFIYLFMAALGLCCCAWAFSSCSEWGLLFIAVRRLLIAVASLVAEHGLQAHRLQQLWHMGSVVVAYGLQSAGSVVVVHGLSCSVACGIFPRPGFKSMSPALAGGFLTIAPPGKSERYFKRVLLLQELTFKNKLFWQILIINGLEEGKTIGQKLNKIQWWKTMQKIMKFCLKEVETVGEAKILVTVWVFNDTTPPLHY